MYLEEESNRRWSCWCRRRRNGGATLYEEGESSAMRGRPALLPLRDMSAVYGSCTELTYQTRKENVVPRYVVLTDHIVVLRMNLHVWLFYVFGPKTSMAATVRDIRYKRVVSKLCTFKMRVIQAR
jgi:hypothetical protein